jgi:hypothetical protein
MQYRVEYGMIRMGTAIFPNPSRGDNATWWHARCLAAINHKQQVCRIPLQMIAPLPAIYALIGELLKAHRLRLVRARPNCASPTIDQHFERIAAFFVACMAYDSVIVCHVQPGTTRNGAHFAITSINPAVFGT